MFVYMKTYEYESRGGLPVVWVFRQSYSGEVKREDIRVRDNTDFPYRPDASVLGEWRVCDLVENIEQFSPDKQYFPNDALFFNSVRFDEGGKCVACYGTDTKKQYECDWTKDIILHKQQELAEHYELKSLSGKDYLFIEWKNGDYQFGGRAPRYYVFYRS
jgi:hypothetical protein